MMNVEDLVREDKGLHPICSDTSKSREFSRRAKQALKDNNLEASLMNFRAVTKLDSSDREAKKYVALLENYTATLKIFNYDHYLSFRYNDAVKHMKNVVDIDPNFKSSLDLLRVSAVLAGDWKTIEEVGILASEETIPTKFTWKVGNNYDWDWDHALVFFPVVSLDEKNYSLIGAQIMAQFKSMGYTEGHLFQKPPVKYASFFSDCRWKWTSNDVELQVNSPNRSSKEVISFFSRNNEFGGNSDYGKVCIGYGDKGIKEVKLSALGKLSLIHPKTRISLYEPFDPHYAPKRYPTRHTSSLTNGVYPVIMRLHELPFQMRINWKCEGRFSALSTSFFKYLASDRDYFEYASTFDVISEVGMCRVLSPGILVDYRTLINGTNQTVENLNVNLIKQK